MKCRKLERVDYEAFHVYILFGNFEHFAYSISLSRVMKISNLLKEERIAW